MVAKTGNSKGRKGSRRAVKYQPLQVDSEGQQAVHSFQSRLSPEFRRRLMDKLDDQQVPDADRHLYLSAVTGRAQQTTRRWIDSEKPGLPDLTSFGLLCLAFNSDANWFLGLAKLHENLVHATNNHDQVDHEVSVFDQFFADLHSDCSKEMGQYFPMKMMGDEMWPTISEGDTIFVDISVDEINGNGLYWFEYQGMKLVRRVEVRVGEGIVLSCDNERYPIVIRLGVKGNEGDLNVLGRIVGGIGLQRF